MMRHLIIILIAVLAFATVAAPLSAMKAYLSSGGFLFVEAVVGDKAFAASIREVLTGAALELKALGATSPLLSGNLGGASGYAVGHVRYSRALTLERIGKPEPLVFGIYSGSALVGVYSPFDIMFLQTGCRAFNSRGYLQADARALATNIALMAATHKPPPATPD